MAFYLAIVSPLDTPLYEIQFTTSKPGQGTVASGTFPSWSSYTALNGGEVTSAIAPPPPQSANIGQLQQQQQNLGVGQGGPGERHILQMIAHAGLDAVEEVAEGNGSLYLKSVDKHNEWTVSAFLATNVKLILLHDMKNDDGIRLFFGDVWELYTKIALNPFHSPNTPIRNALFETKIRASAKKHL